MQAELLDILCLDMLLLTMVLWYLPTGPVPIAAGNFSSCGVSDCRYGRSSHHNGRKGVDEDF